MSLTATPNGDRVQIAIFGRRNAGKSSVINAVTGQQLAIVSDVKGTTTDPVYKAMEILPIGPCMFIDTPGLDDEGTLGRMRVEKAIEVLNRTDIAMLVLDVSRLTKQELESGRGMGAEEEQILAMIEEKKLPYVIVLNQADKLSGEELTHRRQCIMAKNGTVPVCAVSTVQNMGLDALKDALVMLAPDTDLKLHILGDLVEKDDVVLLVVPVDSAAPKGRLIMPQQQTIRDLLDHHAIPIVTQVEELAGVLSALADKVKLVITESQAFKEVNQIVPADIPLTSFSILFARHKGNLQQLMEGVRMVEQLRDGDKVLIAEGCTHRRQCDDIGTVKIPNWLRTHTGCKLDIETCSGSSFPADLTSYAMVIHCGGCTLHEKEMKHRIFMAKEQKVPIVNYGIFIAYINGIVQRSTELFRDK